MILFVDLLRKQLRETADQEKDSGHQGVMLMHSLREREREAKFKKMVENGTLNYVNFWCILQEKNPKYLTFQDTGFKILDTNLKIDKLWDSFKKRKSIPLSSLRLFSTFSEEIQEDQVKSQEIREYIHEAKDSAQEDPLLCHSINGTGVITVSAEGENQGYIKQYNAGFSRISGYSLQDLVQAPLSIIIPTIYQDSHRESLHASFSKGEAASQNLGIDKKVFMVAKTKYLIPVVIRVVEIPNYANSYMYIATVMLNKERIEHSIMHILFNLDREIIGITSSKK